MNVCEWPTNCHDRPIAVAVERFGTASVAVCVLHAFDARAVGDGLRRLGGRRHGPFPSVVCECPRPSNIGEDVCAACGRTIATPDLVRLLNRTGRTLASEEVQAVIKMQRRSLAVTR